MVSALQAASRAEHDELPDDGWANSMGIGRAERALAERGTLIAKRYRVRTFVGSESVALVYVATHVTTNRQVLVKVVHDDDDLSREERVAEVLEMEREARAASMVEHPNVAPILDFERTATGKALWCASTRRPSSRTPSAEQGRSTPRMRPTSSRRSSPVCMPSIWRESSIAISRPTTSSFSSARGVDRSSRLPAWGARSAPPSGSRTIPRRASTTRPPSSSPQPPGAVDHRSDLFSCGVILFEMLTGRRPFEAATTDEVRTAILHDTPPSAAQLAPQLGGEWLELLEKALAKDPAKRFQNARELQRALPSRTLPTKRLQLLSDTAEQVALTETIPASEGPRSRTGANIGSKCDPYIGRMIGSGYALETLLGSGTAGAVYKAIHTRLRRPVAVKILHDRHRTSQQYVERFKAEALLASKLDHPNVMRVLDCGEESDGRLFLVMEYLEGQSLAAVLAEERQLPQTRAVTIAIQILSSLVVAHAAGIVHRDMKPENIILLAEPRRGRVAHGFSRRSATSESPSSITRMSRPAVSPTPKTSSRPIRT